MRVRTEAGVRAYPVPPLGLLDEQHVLENTPLVKLRNHWQAMQGSKAAGDGREPHSPASYNQVFRWDLRVRMA